MDHKQIAKKTLEFILDLIFPVLCLNCGKEGDFLCAGCGQKLPHLVNQKCIVCALPSPFGKTHEHCRSQHTVDGMLVSLPYTDPLVKNLVATFKYKFIPPLADTLAIHALEEVRRQNLADYFSNFQIVPVPLHPRRLRWRTFNQAEMLSEIISKQLNIQVNSQLATRKKYTKPQARFKKHERTQNLANAFKLSEQSIDGRFLLVDDVITTGATVNELAKMLKKAGAKEVWALAAAHG